MTYSKIFGVLQKMQQDIFLEQVVAKLQASTAYTFDKIRPHRGSFVEIL